MNYSEESMFRRQKEREEEGQEKSEVEAENRFLLGLSLEKLEKNIRKERKFKYEEESYFGKIERGVFEKELSETIESAKMTKTKYEETIRNEMIENEKKQKEEKSTNLFQELIKSGNVLTNITGEDTVMLFCKEKKEDKLIVKRFVFNRKYIGEEATGWEDQQVGGYATTRIVKNKNKPIAWRDVYAIDVFTDVKEKELTPEEVVSELNASSIEKLLQSR